MNAGMQWREFIALLVARRRGRSAAGVMRVIGRSAVVASAELSRPFRVSDSLIQQGRYTKGRRSWPSSS